MAIDRYSDYKLYRAGDAKKRYQNRKEINKEFGQTGLDVYNAINDRRTSEEIREFLDIGDDEFFEILEFLEEHEMIEVEEAVEEEYAEEKPVTTEEKIRKKYGDIGLEVYALVDGERSLEEISEETGISEEELMEMLSFMKKEGILDLEYPEETEKAEEPEEGYEKAEEYEEAKPTGFSLILESEKDIGTGSVSSPLIIPSKGKWDLFKDVRVHAKLVLKYGKNGERIYHLINGKNNINEISVKLGLPLYKVAEILGFLSEYGEIILKKMPRNEVEEKYGSEAFAVYKKYGKEGLMLYELLGGDLSVIQLADMIMTDRSKFLEMLLFVYEVLDVELPASVDVMKKKLGIE